MRLMTLCSTSAVSCHFDKNFQFSESKLLLLWLRLVAALCVLSLPSVLLAAEPKINPYCVSGANWSPKGVMAKLRMPGGETNPYGSLGYIWDVLQPTNIPNMVRPKRYWEFTGKHKILFQGYDHEKDEILEPEKFSQWVKEHPGRIWIIGNEQNHHLQDGLKPDEYARMFHTYYDFIKVQGRDPNAKFATGACLALGEGDWIKNNTDYWNKALAEYRKQFGTDMPIDIWNNHCYVFAGDLDPDTMIAKFFKPFREYVETVSGGMYADCPVWCTEFGVGMWATPCHPDYVADFIRQLCPRLEQEYVLSNGKKKKLLDRWFWFLGPHSKDMFRNSCLLGPDGKPTAPGKVYARLANRFPNRVPSPPPAPKKSVPVVKSTFDKKAYPWRIWAGDWAVEDGVFTHKPRPQPKWGTYAHLPFWYKDFRIEADVRIDKAEKDNYCVGFTFRHGTIWKDGRKGYSAAICKNGDVVLSSKKHKKIKTVEKAVTDVSKFHRLGVAVAGSHFEVTLDSQTVITWDDPDNYRTEGFVSLMAGMCDAGFDNVEVHTLNKN